MLFTWWCVPGLQVIKLKHYHIHITTYFKHNIHIYLPGYSSDILDKKFRVSNFFPKKKNYKKLKSKTQKKVENGKKLVQNVRRKYKA